MSDLRKVRKSRRSYSPEQRAAAVEAVANGELVTTVAARLGVPTGTVGSWVAGGRSVAIVHADRATLTAAVTAYVVESMETLRVQAAFYRSDVFLTNPELVHAAGGLAALHAVLADRVIRILPALYGPTDGDDSVPAEG